MSEMKTVTINGVTYTVHDPDALSGTDTTLSVAGKAADAAAVGAALGSALKTAGYNLSASTDFNTVTQQGIYWCNTWVGSGGANLPNGQDTGWMTVYSGYETTVVQEYHSNGGGLLRRIYSPDTGAWGAWEWENPPMVPGVFYRTVESWNGYPVYTVCVDCGTLPDTSSKQKWVVGEVPNLQPIACEMFYVRAEANYRYSTTPDVTAYAANYNGGLYVIINTTGNASDCSAYAILKYALIV